LASWRWRGESPRYEAGRAWRRPTRAAIWVIFPRRGCAAAQGAAALACLVAGGLVRNNVAEQLPGLSLEPLQLHGLQRIEVARAGVDLDARQQHGQVDVLQIRRLLHDIGSREIVTALLEDDGQQRRHGITVGI